MPSFRNLTRKLWSHSTGYPLGNDESGTNVLLELLSSEFASVKRVMPRTVTTENSCQERWRKLLFDEFTASSRPDFYIVLQYFCFSFMYYRCNFFLACHSNQGYSQQLTNARKVFKQHDKNSSAADIKTLQSNNIMIKQKFKRPGKTRPLSGPQHMVAIMDIIWIAQWDCLCVVVVKAEHRC